jgi:hypothetical protein
MIQDSISNYNYLKKEVTSKNHGSIMLPVLKKDPKLCVRNLGIDIANIPVRRLSRPSVRLRSKTEGHEPCETTRREERLVKIIDVVAKKHPVTSCGVAYAKQYHQMSLREIVEEEEGTSQYRLKAKLAEICIQREKEAYKSRRTSDDYSLNGW